LASASWYSTAGDSAGQPLAFNGSVDDPNGAAILADNNRRVEMGKLARAKAEANFCSAKIISQYEGYYQKIIDRG